MNRWAWVLVGVLVLIGMSGLVAPRFVTRGDRKVGQGRADFLTLKNLVDRFRLDCGRYPTTAEGLAPLSRPPPALKRNWRGTYPDHLVDDAWGKPYLYQSDGRSYTLRTLGADGKPGGTGEDADLEATN